MFYPDESLQASQQNNGLFPKYGVMDTNIFVRIRFIQSCLKENSAELFKYRLRNRQNVNIYNSNLKMSGVDVPVNSFNFELSIFNLVKLARNIKVVLKTGQIPLLFTKGPQWPRDNEKTMLATLRQLEDLHC